MTLGERIRTSRKAASLTQAELADQMGISVQAVSQWETNRNSPSTSNMIALANKLSVTLAWLSDGLQPEAMEYTTRQHKPSFYRAPLLTMEHYYRLATGERPEKEPDEVSLEVTRATGTPVMALIIDDDSMSPLFMPEDIVMVDAYLAPQPGDFTCYIDIQAKQILFRQVSFEGASETGSFSTKLIPLNTMFATKVIVTDQAPGHGSMFCGTMIEHRRFRPGFKRSFRSGP